MQDLPAAAPRRRPPVPLVIAAGTGLVVALGGALYVRASAHTEAPPLAERPRGVTVVEARPAEYRDHRRYVGTIEPWVSARLGPQLVSAYVDTVLVRPGSVVKRGQVVATLDCRGASAASQAVAAQARALEAKQAAISHEAQRVSGMLEGGFVSENEAEQKTAESASRMAELLATRARLLGSTLEVRDCVLRAPFAGEIAERSADPGAFVRPGSAIATLVERRTVRVTADVPETDFAAVPPGAPIRISMLATGRSVTAKIARRSPAADPITRTVHVEIDLEDPARNIPVGTTAELDLEVGQAVPAIEVPLQAATVRGKNATLFVVEGDVARKRVVTVRGERKGQLFLAPELPAGAKVVTEGRGTLADGDRVTAAPARPAEPVKKASAATSTGTRL